MNKDLSPVKVVEAFEKSHPHSDAKTISEALGFASHREMADYMMEHGFLWDSKKSNYYEETDPNKLNQVGSDAQILSIFKYLPLLKLLNENQSTLMDLLGVVEWPFEGHPDYVQRQVEIPKLLDHRLTAYCQNYHLHLNKVVELALEDYLKTVEALE